VSQNVIELNGKRYDAITGAYLGKSVTKPTTAPRSNGRALDGIIRPAQTARPVKNHAATTKVITSLAKTSVAHAKAAAPHSHPAAKPLGAHQPQRSQTLMRRVVHKPKSTLKPNIKPQAPAEMMAKPQSALVRKQSASQVDPLRLRRAAGVSRHQAVQRFRPQHGTTEHRTTVNHVPVIAVRPAPRPQAPRPAPIAQPRPGQSHSDIFERAIAHATSHQQPPHQPRTRRRHRRLVNTLAIIGTFLVIGGFVGFLNLSNLQLRVASMQAGFQASRPGYTPTGYEMAGGIQRSGGTVSMSFRSGASSYTLTQQASEWTSQTLLDNTLALSGSHKTIQKNGQTIYVYDSGAAWVNGGIRYDLSGNADLSTDELTAIATSL
jgi:Domain of unknown function (DUF4367)